MCYTLLKQNIALLTYMFRQIVEAYSVYELHLNSIGEMGSRSGGCIPFHSNLDLGRILLGKIYLGPSI